MFVILNSCSDKECKNAYEVAMQMYSSTKINNGNADRITGGIRCILEIWYKAGVWNKES
ncbi:hypothetical protein AALB81_19570 [Lachnospiraceae bacterium 48-33]